MAIAIGLPIVVVLLFTVILLIWHNRKRSYALVGEGIAKTQQKGHSQEDFQPYLQQKAELEAKEIKIVELEALERPYEIGYEGQRYELPVNEDGIMRMRQELRGEEHSKELASP